MPVRHRTAAHQFSETVDRPVLNGALPDRRAAKRHEIDIGYVADIARNRHGRRGRNVTYHRREPASRGIGIAAGGAMIASVGQAEDHIGLAGS